MTSVDDRPPVLPRAWWLGLPLMAAGWLALAVQWLPTTTPLRPVLVFGFTLLGPGAAVVMLLPLVDRLERLMLSLAASVALGIVVSEALALAHMASSKTSIAILAGITTILVIARLIRSRSRSHRWEAPMERAR